MTTTSITPAVHLGYQKLYQGGKFWWAGEGWLGYGFKTYEDDKYRHKARSQLGGGLLIGFPMTPSSSVFFKFGVNRQVYIKDLKDTKNIPANQKGGGRAYANSLAPLIGAGFLVRINARSAVGFETHYTFPRRWKNFIADAPTPDPAVPPPTTGEKPNPVPQKNLRTSSYWFGLRYSYTI